MLIRVLTHDEFEIPFFSSSGGGVGPTALYENQLSAEIRVVEVKKLKAFYDF